MLEDTNKRQEFKTALKRKPVGPPDHEFNALSTDPQSRTGIEPVSLITGQFTARTSSL